MKMELVMVVVVLVSAFFSLVLLITVYIRQRAQSRVRGGGGGGGSVNTSFLFSEAFGVADDVIRRLPTFRYSGIEIGKGSVHCAVCLAEFVGEEMLRQLPKCGHVFHSRCIDPWLSAHATCPLCRTSLVPGPGQDLSFGAVQMAEPEMNTNQEPN